jgi:hypothetical protein
MIQAATGVIYNKDGVTLDQGLIDLNIMVQTVAASVYNLNGTFDPDMILNPNTESLVGDLIVGLFCIIGIIAWDLYNKKENASEFKVDIAPRDQHIERQKPKRESNRMHLESLGVRIGNIVYFGVFDLINQDGRNLRALYLNNHNVLRGEVMYNNMITYVNLDRNNSMHYEDYERLVREQTQDLIAGPDSRNLNQGRVLSSAIWGYNFPSPSRATWISLKSTRDLRITTGIERSRNIEPTTDNINYISIEGVYYTVNRPCSLIRIC